MLIREKVCDFSSAFLYVHIRTNQTVTYWTKVFRKKFFCQGVQLYFEISLLSFIHKIFEQNFYLYITVYLVRIWTYKMRIKSAYFFKEKQKRKKWTKRDEKRILCKFTVRHYTFPTKVTFKKICYFFRGEKGTNYHSSNVQNSFCTDNIIALKFV